MPDPAPLAQGPKFASPPWQIAEKVLNPKQPSSSCNVSERARMSLQRGRRRRPGWYRNARLLTAGIVQPSEWSARQWQSAVGRAGTPSLFAAFSLLHAV